MSKYSKMKGQVDFSNKVRSELSQEKVDQIAYRLLVEKREVKEITVELQIPFKIIESIKNTTTHKEKWINAIAKLGRMNLIQD
tara:strand:+ start:2001 stop:2249 length:249 start_codon:yes stop_codon:yes gene_type:complete